MSVVVIASYVVAAALALSRLLEAAKPFWTRIPPKIAAIIPSIVAMLPVLIEKMSGVKTGQDFVQALIVAGALLLPGAGVSGAQKTDPPKN
jgi:hypothetical protein